MSPVAHAPHASATLDAVYRADWGRIVATLIRLVRDFDVAEDAAQEAFAAAVDQWPMSGVPHAPRAWIIQTARHKAIDRIRRQTRFVEKLDAYTAAGASVTVEAPEFDPSDIPDDRLRLIFTCCHPALALEARGLYPYSVDLGQAWKAWTGLPFVFAVWAARRDANQARVREVHERLLESLDWGMQHLDLLADQAWATTGIARATCRAYFDDLDYGLSYRHLDGLTDFFLRLAHDGLVPDGSLSFISAA